MSDRRFRVATAQGVSRPSGLTPLLRVKGRVEERVWPEGQTHGPAVTASTLQLLDWISSGTRTYDEVIEAWRTSCPRLSVWEDALHDGLVVCRAGRPAIVELTSRGRAVLDERG